MFPKAKIAQVCLPILALALAVAFIIPPSWADEGGVKNVIVRPTGSYATIDTTQAVAAINKLNGDIGQEDQGFIKSIQAHSDRYLPPVFYVLAKALYAQGNVDDALFWFHAGRLRANFDAIRCTDISARSALGELAAVVPVDLRKRQFDDPVKLKTIITAAIKWDETTPYNYDYRWINLHGLGAIQSGLGGNTSPPGPLTVPQDTWDSLAKQNRADYRDSLDKALEMIREKHPQ